MCMALVEATADQESQGFEKEPEIRERPNTIVRGMYLVVQDLLEKQGG